jgi:transposase
MKPYSLDLRQKIVEAYQNGEGSFRQLTHRFKVSLSFVQRLLKKFADTKSIEPLPIGRGPQAQLNSSYELILKHIEECNNLTLEQLCERLETENPVKVSVLTMCRFLKKHKLTGKKTTHAPKANTQEVQLERFEYWQKIASFDF